MTDYLDPAPPLPRRRDEDDYAEGDGAAAQVLPPDPGDEPYEAREFPDLVPPALRRAITDRRDRWTRVDTIAAAIIGLHLFLLFIAVVGGSLYLDDLRAQAYALNQPFWSFIAGSNGTHFAPLPRVLDWVQSRAFPLQHGPAVVITLLIRLAFTAIFWRLLRRVFGPHRLTLVPLVLLVITPAMLPATLWYRQSITIVACTVAMLWAVDAHLRWLLTGRRAALAEVVAATAIGVGCYEKAAAIPVILAAVTIAIFGRFQRGRPRVGTGAGQQVRNRSLAGIGLSGAVVAGFLVIYRSGPYDQGGAGLPSVLDILHLTWDTATRDIIPLLLGGPYGWTSDGGYGGTAHLSTTAIAITLVITAIGVTVAAVRRPSPSARALLLLLAWTVPSVTIVALGRFETLQLILADATRLWIDLVPVFLFAIALAVLPWEIGVCRSAPGAVRARSGSAARRSSAPSTDGALQVTGGRRAARAAQAASGRRGPVELTVPVLAAGLALAVIAAGSAVSSISYVSRWWDNPTGTWLKNMTTSVNGAEAYARILATPLPPDVMPTWVSSELPTSAPLMQLLRDDLRFQDGDGKVRALNAQGVLSQILQAPIASGPDAALCVQKIPVGSTKPVGIKLTQPAIYVAGAQLEVGVLLDEVTPVKVQVRTTDNQVLTPEVFTSAPVPAGAHVLLYPVPLGKAITTIYVSTNATRTGCVASVRVWAPVTGP